ncbi:hypothetical protein BGZ94_000338 [Podila epigama]|nr:hypothetical protein BGZ94_000338 [Podila epigama]
MGWFSRSSSSQSPATATEATTNTQESQSNEPLVAEPTISKNSTTTTTATTDKIDTQEDASSSFIPVPEVPIDAIQFDEYKEPEDIFARFKVSDAMNQLAACSSLGANVRNYYRFGTFKECGARYDHLKFCLSIKTKSSQVAQVMIQKRDAQLAAKKAKAPNSEDVWTLRKEPPKDLLAAAYAAQE